MNSLNFKIILCLSLLLLSLQVGAQEHFIKEETPQHARFYGKRIERYYSVWNALIPKYTKMQFAGSMGMLSFGVGWNYGKDRWETDMMFGFVPKSTHNLKTNSAKELKTMGTFTLKQNYIPWRIPIHKDIIFEPLSCGLYFNTLLNGDFWTKQPSKYPEGYYFFSTKVRTLLFVGERITFKLNHKYRWNKSITLFYEFSTSDLYLLCAVKDKELKPRDYLGLSLGIKLQIL
ncbi:hypothetical protein [Parabacteroides sp. PF5-9]|uniref:hypothetical protein n=1 Tax=Parabacteroides sp. PF5-9 TaxID=1742404 RepID=UPI0024738989|nr:hypothetical protein [Parabacteroides sp. PF5-9]MDH6356509.1 hypothetical protein [Parabacteroides sp. PF5-9]